MKEQNRNRKAGPQQKRLWGGGFQGEKSQTLGPCYKLSRTAERKYYWLKPNPFLKEKEEEREKKKGKLNTSELKKNTSPRKKSLDNYRLCQDRKGHVEKKILPDREN